MNIDSEDPFSDSKTVFKKIWRTSTRELSISPDGTVALDYEVEGNFNQKRKITCNWIALKNPGFYNSFYLRIETVLDKDMITLAKDVEGIEDFDRQITEAELQRIQRTRARWEERNDDDSSTVSPSHLSKRATMLFKA